MMEVEIHNCQSIEHAVVKIEGFTALTGRSNVGKTAIIRAIKAALTGAPAGPLVRHGTDCARRTRGASKCSCFVSVHMRGKDFDLLWEKGDPVNRYTFNGQVYTNVDKGMPDFLKATFGMVRIGDENQLLQVSDQFYPIFLLDESGTVVADVLSDVARLDRINVAIRLSEKDRKDAISTRKVREKDIQDGELRLREYDGLDTAVACVDIVSEQYRAIEEAHGKVAGIECYLQALKVLKARILELVEASKVEVPDPAPLVAKQEAIALLNRFVEEIRQKATNVRTLLGAEKVVIPDGSKIQELGRRVIKLERWTANLAFAETWLRRYKTVKDLEPPDWEPVEQVASRVMNIERWMFEQDSLNRDLVRIDGELEEIGRKVDALRAESEAFGMCPTCLQPLHVGVC